MATKNCPTCSKQVPVACKKCICGHIFFSTRKGAGASAASASTAKDFAQTQQDLLGDNFGDFQPIRRTGRRPEKPKFYDALQYENQTRKDFDTSLNTEMEALSVSNPDPTTVPEDEFLSDMDIDKDLAEPAEDYTFPHVLVTVGTTSYDELINILCKAETLSQLLTWRTRQVRVQIGNSQLFTEGEDMISGIYFNFFRFKPSLMNDIEWANVIISHAGAGTTLDVLDANKTLIVIPNTNLMDNHQMELSEHLNLERYAYSASFETYHDVMKSVRKSHIRQFPTKDEYSFSKFMIAAMKFEPLKVSQAILDMEAKAKKVLSEGQEAQSRPSGDSSRKPRFTM